MRVLFAIVALAIGLTLLGSATGGSAPPAPAREAADTIEAEVLAVVDSLFDAMRARDTLAMRAVFHPDARLMRSGRDGVPGVSQTPIDGFIRSIGGAQAYLDEVTWDEEAHVFGLLASAWTPYAFYADGAFSHCGVNAFQLVRLADGWKILQITDTAVPEGCPEGMPARP